MDQIDYFLSKLRRRFGDFVVIQNPYTGVCWPAETFIHLVAPVLWKEDDQIELYFWGVRMSSLIFRIDARERFIEMAEREGIFVDVSCPRPVNLGIENT